jgi:hypothetical protein
LGIKIAAISLWKGIFMVAYKLYWRDDQNQEHFIGVLPERRRNPERITQESLVNWSRMVLGDKAGIDLDNIFFVQIELQEN